MCVTNKKQSLDFDENEIIWRVVLAINLILQLCHGMTNSVQSFNNWSYSFIKEVILANQDIVHS